MPQGNRIRLNGHTVLVPGYDPVFRTFNVQLWKNGDPADTYGLGEKFTHPDDVIDTIDDFLDEHGVAPLSEKQLVELGRELIMAKGGPDAALLKMAEQDPKRF